MTKLNELKERNKLKTISRLKRVLVTVAAVCGFAVLPMAHSQQTASIQGHANDEIGVAIKDGEVRLTQDLATPPEKRKYLYTFPTDANGDFKGTGIAPGTYLVNLFRTNTSVDYLAEQPFKAGETKTENFDLSRAEYLAKLTPERRKQIEEFKAKNAAAASGNKQIANLNATMAAVRADLKTPTPNYDKDIADSKAATEAKPDEGLLWVLYADSLEAKAEHGAADDRKNKVNPNTDDAVKQTYAGAIDAYKKANDVLSASDKKTAPETEATVYNQLGNALSRSGNPTEAVAAFDKAVSLQPQSAGMYYGNEAAVLFNAQQSEQALAAAEKAIAADPTKPNPYFIKGQELLQKASVDPKTGKIVAPPGCVDAYQKYLELAPDGPQAPGIRDTLTAMGEKINQRYSAGKKK